MDGTWMRRIRRCVLGAGLLLASTAWARAGGDDSGSGLLGRLFRMGGQNSSSATPSPTATQDGSQPAPLPYGGSYGNVLPPGGSSGPASAPLPAFGGLPETPVLPGANGPTERLTPKSRVSSAVTTADPVLTRVALGRSNDGNPFGMFLQVFADGTVVDSEGVHHIRAVDLKPIVDSVQSGELYRLRGHCGAPSTDFIEYVHIVIYERRLGRLQAHSFSYSGNPQGCDHAVRHLHTALENLQAKISRQPGAESAGAVSMTPAVPGAGSGTPAMTGTSTAVRSIAGDLPPTTIGRQPAMPAAMLPGPSAPGAAVIPLSPAPPAH